MLQLIISIPFYLEMKDNTLILGCGYTGTFYLAKFKDADWTSRKPSVARCSQLPDEVNRDIREPICFNLVDRSTWTNIPDSKNVLWTFAIRDSHEGELALEFFEAHLKNRNVIVYSSTSAYKFETQNEGQSSEFFFLFSLIFLELVNNF